VKITDVRPAVRGQDYVGRTPGSAARGSYPVSQGKQSVVGGRARSHGLARVGIADPGEVVEGRSHFHHPRARGCLDARERQATIIGVEAEGYLILKQGHQARPVSSQSVTKNRPTRGSALGSIHR